MAVRKIPYETQLVDLGLPEETPMDKITKAAQGFSQVLGTIDTIRTTRAGENVAAMQALFGAINNARTPDDMTSIKNIYEQNINHNIAKNSPEYNTAVELFNIGLSKKNDMITDFNFESQKWGDKLFSADNKFGVPIWNMERDQLVDMWTELTPEEQKGYGPGLLKDLAELDLWAENLEAIHGGKASSDYKIHVKGMEGKKSYREIQQAIQRFRTAGESMVHVALDDGVLSLEEAQELSLLTGEEGFDTNSFQALQTKKQGEAVTNWDLSRTYLHDTVIKAFDKLIDTDDFKTTVRSQTGLNMLTQISQTIPEYNQYIPNLESETLTTVGGETHTLPEIRENMPASERHAAFLQHLKHGNVDKASLMSLVSGIQGEGMRLERVARNIHEMWGGLESRLGPIPDDVDRKNKWSKTHLDDPDAPIEYSEDNIGKISGIMHKYEDVADSLKDVNNEYAIMYGDRPASYGATDSGIPKEDGGTFAAFESREAMENASKNIMKDMLDDVDGNVTEFVKNYIGIDNADDPQVQSRVREIQEA